MSEGISNYGRIGFLDNVRLSNGRDCLVNYFHNLLINNKGRAVELVNDDNLQYCSLYLLRQELEDFWLENSLNERNQTALRITKNVADKNSEGMQQLTQYFNPATRVVLRWILATGYPDDGMSMGYSMVMEHAAIQLSRKYRDPGLLNEVSEMIFTRYRKGMLVHNLVWAFFEARSADSLMIIARRLCSTESGDIELTKKLLFFIPAIAENRHTDPAALYNEAVDWISRNRNIMEYTGESLHQAVKPLHYHIPSGAGRDYRPDPPDGHTPPSVQPAIQPASQQTTQPAEQHTTQPASQQTTQPADQHTTQPTDQHTTQPAEQHTTQPAGEHPPKPADPKIKYEEVKKKYPDDSIERKILDLMAKSQSDPRYDSEDELRFELGLRRKIIDNSYALARSRMRFQTFHETECNEEYWKRMENGGFRLRNGVRPSQGIKDIFRHSGEYATECATAIMMIFYKAVLDIYGEELFDRTFPEIILMDWMYTDNKLGVATYRKPDVLLPGDCRYFRNPDVDPMTPEWQGENAIDLGNGTYYGHGIGIRDEETMIRILNKFRIKGSEVSAYLMDTATRPDFYGLYRTYAAGSAPGP